MVHLDVSICSWKVSSLQTQSKILEAVELNETEHKLCKQIVLITDAVWSLEYC